MNREELEAYIRNHYATLPDYPWADTPRAAVFRHAGNRKWFALVMEVPRDKLGLAGTEKLDIVNFKCNPIFYKFFVKANAFTASSACIGCGQCAKRCPMNNVALKDGKPVWGKVCTHCMACICYCPVSAIEYGKKSVGQPRYHFEAL